MTRDELVFYGIEIKIAKRQWLVTFRSQVVASGKIGKEYDARNRARKEALEAATVVYVKYRVNGTLDRDANRRTLIHGKSVFGHTKVDLGKFAAQLQAIREDIERVTGVEVFDKPD